MKYKFKIKDYKLLVKVKIPFNSKINEQELSFFNRKILRGFFKAELKKSSLLEYSGPIGIPLSERLEKPINKYDFFFIIEQIIDSIQKLQKYNLLLNKVVWNIDYAFINEATKELQFIYLPLSSGDENCNNVLTFIENISYLAKPGSEYDPDFVSRFVYFLRSLNGFDPKKIEEYIKTEDRDVVNTIQKNNISGFMTDKPRDYYRHYSEQNGEADKKDSGGDDSYASGGNFAGQSADEDATGLLVEDEEDATGLLVEDEEDATGLLVEDEEDATGLLVEDDDDATGLLVEDEEDATGLLVEDDDDATGLLVEDDGAVNRNDVYIHYPSIYRILTNETIIINKPVFRIGKERSYVDYFVNNNNAVSRSHADIVTRGTRCFVVDLNSKNRTYINGQVLPIKCEIEIFDGDHLKLGNEEFVFSK